MEHRSTRGTARAFSRFLPVMMWLTAYDRGDRRPHAEVEDMLVASGVLRIVGTVDFSHDLQDVVEETVGERKSR